VRGKLRTAYYARSILTIILFGSRARGQPRAESDWDILVVADSRLPRHQRSPPLYGALSDLRQPIDILVYTPEEIEKWHNVESAFITTAVREGKVLYENKN
jgi:predicted nucleotidyltransferase